MRGQYDRAVAESVIVRPRLPSDMDACVSLLRQLHEHDSYPLAWPADPRAWLRGNRQVKAWVPVREETICGHVALTSPRSGAQPPGRGRKALTVRGPALWPIPFSLSAP